MVLMFPAAGRCSDDECPGTWWVLEKVKFLNIQVPLTESYFASRLGAPCLLSFNLPPHPIPGTISPFRDRETEAQRGEAICLKSHSQQEAEPGTVPRFT